MRSEQISKMHELAIRAGLQEVVKSWRDKLDFFNARDALGNSLLGLAAKYGQMELVKYFVGYGLPIESLNHEGLTASELARANGHENVYDFLANQSIINSFKANSDLEKDSSSNDEYTENESNYEQWEAEADQSPPENNDSIEQHASYDLKCIQKHKPIVNERDWQHIKIELPSTSSQRVVSQCDYPGVCELLIKSILSSEPIPLEKFYAAIDNDLIVREKDIPNFFWEKLPQYIGFVRDHNFLIFPSNFIGMQRIPDDEVERIVRDALSQVHTLSECWLQRLYSQAMERDVLDRIQEERLGQRMDSALYAIRNLVHEHNLQSFFHKLASGRSSVELSHGNENFESDTEIDEGMQDNDRAEDFLRFLCDGEGVVNTSESPPRPSNEILNQIKQQIEALTNDVRRRFLRKIRDYYEARDQFLLSNLRLALSIGKKYRCSHHLSFEDHIQHALIGLLNAIDKYDYRMGNKFSTYSSWWVKQSIHREIANQINTIRLPVHIYQLKQRVARWRNSFGLLERNADVTNQVSEFSQSELEKVDKATYFPVEVDQISQTSIEDFIYVETSHYEDPFEALSRSDEDIYILKIVQKLEPREQQIVKMRFGLEDYSEHTLEQVGQMFGLTRERIRQLERTAILKLKRIILLD